MNNIDCSKCVNANSKLFGQCPILQSFTKADETAAVARSQISDITGANLEYNLDLQCDHFVEDEKQQYAIAAVTAIVIRNDNFLISERIGSHGMGTWCLPGGKIDFGENWFCAVQREVVEETGLNTSEFKFHGLTNDYFPEDKKHFVNIIVSCITVDKDVQPRTVEPNKNKGWQWVHYNRIEGNLIKDKVPLFLSLQNVLNTINLKNIILARGRDESSRS